MQTRAGPLIEHEFFDLETLERLLEGLCVEYVIGLVFEVFPKNGGFDVVAGVGEEISFHAVSVVVPAQVRLGMEVLGGVFFVTGQELLFLLGELVVGGLLFPLGMELGLGRGVVAV